jgi:hypothetical protein
VGSTPEEGSRAVVISAEGVRVRTGNIKVFGREFGWIREGISPNKEDLIDRIEGVDFELVIAIPAINKEL